MFWQEGMGSWVLGEKAPFSQAERLGLEFTFRQGVLFLPLAVGLQLCWAKGGNETHLGLVSSLSFPPRGL